MPEAAVPPAPVPQSDNTENPPWSGWDLVYIVLVMVGMVVLSLWVVAYIARRVAYPHLPLFTIMNFPMVAFSSQMLAYVVVLGFMFTTATAHAAMADLLACGDWVLRRPSIAGEVPAYAEEDTDGDVL